MIIPMHKYSFLVYHADYSGFLEDLKQLGVVHIIESDNEPTSELQEGFREVNDVAKMIKFLQGRKKEDNKEMKAVTVSGQQLRSDIKNAQSQLDLLQQQYSSLEKEYRQLQPWGQFSWDSLTKLQNVGLAPRFFYCANRKFKSDWEQQFNLGVVTEEKGYTYFVIFVEEGDARPELDAEEVRLPDRSLSQLKVEMDEVDRQITEMSHSLDVYAHSGIEILEQYKNQLQEEIDAKHAVLHTADQVDGKVKLLEGYAPETSMQGLESYLEKTGTVYLKAEAVSEEKPPIKLKNNSFFRLFEPIGKLFSLPSYIELDLTPFFAPFFLMFFGFCLGDAGYGLLFVLVATYFKFKVKKDIKPILSLIQWLGLSTVVFGAITGTFFGIKLSESSIGWMQNVKSYFLDNNQMFSLALIFGGIQIMFGMFIKVANQIRQEGFAYSLATWGWILLILSSLGAYVADLAIGTETYFMSTIHLVVLGIAGLGIFVFNHPKRNVFVNVGAGLWDAYGMITGVIGDLLSYIRLFALGLSSAILGLVFNKLAFDLSPDFPVVKQLVILIILFIGHGINIFMSGLGSFVHPMRLTFVEFYKNAGFIGGGREYKPFRKLN
ncbi:V-type ATP synthase subunit I [Marinilabiliaceae bacterium JC017]|nr:V-type ATP synthase subunit I [Marinilabiliaceae bacterium JC017]